MSLQDQRRYLEALYHLSKDDIEAGASFDELEDALDREHGDWRTERRLAELALHDIVELGASRARITAKGLAILGKGP